MISVNKYKNAKGFVKQILCILSVFVALAGCKIYSFKDVSIPPEVKTIRVGFIENRARYVDPH